jgi:nicotinic acid phosphoribosyltransferase
VLLNHVIQTSMATKAARCVLAAGGAEMVDFAFRRTQGIEAGLEVALGISYRRFQRDQQKLRQRAGTA